MDSLGHARDIINNAGTHDGVDTLLASLGFEERPLPLDSTLQQRLGLPPTVLSARVASTSGALRALTVDVASDASMQTCIGSIARRLSLCAPQFLWLLIALQRDSAAVVIATWRCVGSVPRICAMITERGNIVDSDAETLCALVAASQAGDEVMRHMRWMDILGRDAVTQRFFAALSRAVDSLAGSIPTAVPSADRREIAILATSRLLFLSFLETKGWLNEDHGFLANGFAECMASGGQYQRRVLEPLFFGTLNTRVHERAPRARAFGRVPFLNGGLFDLEDEYDVRDTVKIPNNAFAAVLDLFERYNFTVTESTP
ncbi:MAG TPA: hypothetical protein VIG47_17335, partial [Gemmatimonadaceae bacterium]